MLLPQIIAAKVLTKELHYAIISFAISGDNSLRDPPVPIPNTEVKPQHADSTWVATPREGRSSPDSISFGVSTGTPFSFARIVVE